MQVYTQVPIPPPADQAEWDFRDEISNALMNMSSDEIAAAIAARLPAGGPPVRLVP